jgi:hypothetical protein
VIHSDGLILMVQVEDEYGASLVCDHPDMRHLCDVIRANLDKETVLFTTDQPDSCWMIEPIEKTTPYLDWMYNFSVEVCDPM